MGELVDTLEKYLTELSKSPVAGAIVGIGMFLIRLELDRRARRRAHHKAAKKKPA